MDSHDNDNDNDKYHENQNLHLAGEESSKISSVLRPFALPKFDFDDNLHGHLRFDSLVENEVFLGIPGQEDNQWIEDFSRGSGGIVYSSSATESCALPRHDNVWSEATSSESVEMLLKAVGQEEMVPSENVVEESDPVEQLGSSTERTDMKMKQDVCVDEAVDKKSVLHVAEAERDICSLGGTIDIQSVQMKCMLHAHETKLPTYEACNSQEGSLLGIGEKLHPDMKSDCSLGESGCPLSNDPLSKQAEMIISTDIDTSERYSQTNSISIEQAVVDVTNDKGFASPSFVAVSVLEPSEESKEGYNTRDDSIHRADVENVDTDMHQPLEIPAGLEYTEGLVVEIQGKSPSLPDKGEFFSSLEGFQEVAFDVDSSGAREGGNMVFSSTEIKQPSESCNVLPEKSSTGIKGSHVDGPGDLVVSIISGECGLAENVFKDGRDVGGSPDTQEDLTHHPLLVEENQTVREDFPSLQVDVCEHKLDASTLEEEDNKLPLDSAFIDLDDKESELGSTFSGHVAVVDVDLAIIESDLDAPTRDHSVLESEAKDIVSTSSHAEENTLSESHERDTPSDGLANKDLSKDTQFEAHDSGVQQEACEVLGNVTENDTLPDTAVARGPQIADKYSFSSETSSGVIFDEADLEVNEKATHPASEMILQDNVAEATQLRKPEEVEVDRSSTAKFVQATVSAVETDASSVGNFVPTPLKSGVNSLSKEEGTFTFDIRHLGSHSIGGSGTSLPLIPIIQACNSSMSGEGSPSTSGNKFDPVTTKEVSHSTSLMLDAKSSSGGLKGSNEHKSKRGGSKTVKDGSKKGNQLKEIAPLRQTETGDKPRGSLSPLIGGQIMKFESILQPRTAVSTPTSSLPDLNSSTPAFFQQPFTDLQQVQLRAQIFVYGSLIQGVTPDEACMVSAFDGGRSIWEPTWRACVERFHAQKSLGISSETPVQSRTGGKASDQLNRQSFPKSEVLSSLVGRPTNKVISSSVANLIPLSSPLWNSSTPSSNALPSSNLPRSSVFDYPVVSPLHPFQSSPLRNLMTQTTSWSSQVPFPVPWLASSNNSPFDAISNYTPFSIPEPVKLSTPAKELSTPISSGSKHLSSIPAVHTGGTAILPGTSSLTDVKKVAVSTGQVSANPKSRRRKKSSGAEDVVQSPVHVSPADNFSATIIPNQLPKKVASTVEDHNQTSLLSWSQADSMSTAFVSSHYSTSITVTTPTFVPKGSSNQFFSALLPTVSMEHRKHGDIGVNKRAVHVDEFGKVEEAKLHAEEAAKDATAAVRHCQHLWSQLELQKNSGVTPDSEVKLASAAVAIAAAASVAKAAAAAAKIASSAAMQARQMADEGVNYGIASTIEYDACRASGPANYFSNTTPISILRGGDRNNPSYFVISAAREAAKKRVEAATAASRHAENLDAILKAAELAAEAVSHAGKIVTMGDPIPISDLLVAGPDGYWKTSQVASVSISNINQVHPENNAQEVSAKDTDVSVQVVPPVQRELSRAIVDDHIPAEESIAASVKRGLKNVRGRWEKNIPSSAKTNSIILEKNVESRSNSFSPVKYESSTIIKEDSLVEVHKSQGDNKKAWYLASVLSLKDGEALVSYANLHSDQGSEPLKEWVSVEAKDGKPAIIRIPHPMSNVQFEGVRKRCRAALKVYDWSLGDKVDAWVHDCWREGIITENSKKDLTALSVRFPAQGETLVVKLWHLRPTVIWIDDQWIEWSRPGDGRISQGDTPIEKRAKLGNMITETKEKGVVSDDIAFTGLGKNEEPKLSLSASEKTFNIGSTRDVNKPSAPRTTEPGLLKEGSRGVVFGVPKPGKKRKFMEVSKHYVSDKNAKVDVPGDSVKLSKFLTSQGSGSKGWKNKVNPDSRDKQETDGKAKGLKFGKPPAIPSRTFIRKDDSSSLQPNTSDASLLEDKIFVSNDAMEPREENVVDFGSFSNVSEGGMIFSSKPLPPENHKKTSTGTIKSMRFNKGKLAPAGGKSVKNDANEQNLSDASEPRRSNRRIQPTSRLLEGLQSSLTVTKLPSSLHDKNLSKGTSRGNNGHGR